MAKEVEEDANDEAIKQEEDKAFLAEMADPLLDTDAKVPVEEDKQEIKAEEVSDTDGKEPEVDDKEPERVEVMAGYTEQEIKDNFAQLAKLQKSIDTTNGTFGSKFAEQQLIIDELKKGNGDVVGHLSPAIIEKLGEEFPEIAELLKSDSSEGIHGEAAAFDPELVGKTVDEKLSKFRQDQDQKEQARELRLLTREHKDWRELAMFSTDETGATTWSTPAFGEFVKTLPADEQNKLLNVWDADFVSEKITEYKAAIEKPEEKKENKPDLNDAVRDQGLRQTVVVSAEDEEEEAYRKEMAKL